MCCVEAAEEYARNRELNCDGGVRETSHSRVRFGSSFEKS